MPQCGHSRSDGSRCRANARRGGMLCFFHDPEKRSERAQASRKGGRAGTPTVLPDLPKVVVNSASDVCSLLGETLCQVRLGRMDPKVANTIGFLSGALLKAFQQARTEENLQALIAAVTECRRPRSSDDLANVVHLAEE